MATVPQPTPNQLSSQAAHPETNEEIPNFMRSSERKVTTSFTEDKSKQNNFLQKAAILKHLIKEFISKRERKVLTSSRSIRDQYHQKVKDNKLHSLINKGLVGIVKEERKKSKVEKVRKKNTFLRKPTTVLLIAKGRKF